MAMGKTMARFIYSVAILVLAGVASSAQDTVNEELAGTPQFVYMERLRERNKLPKTPLSNDKSIGGTLLATSIQYHYTDETAAVPLKGIPVNNGSITRLLFNIPKQDDASSIHSAELWLFPDPESAPSDGYSADVILSITATIPHARTPRREAIELTWLPGQSCMPVDLTTLTKKISRNLIKQRRNETSVSVEIEFLSVIHYLSEPTGGPASLLEREQYAMCAALHVRTSNKPFLITKFFSDDEVIMATDGVPASPVKRDAEKSNATSQNYTDNFGCSVKHLIASVTDVLGDFILHPRYIDIGTCGGSCPSYVSERTKIHTLLILRMRQNLDAKDVDVCCVPIAFQSVEMLIRIQSGIIALVLVEDLIASECGCR